MPDEECHIDAYKKLLFRVQISSSNLNYINNSKFFQILFFYFIKIKDLFLSKVIFLFCFPLKLKT